MGRSPCCLLSMDQKEEPGAALHSAMYQSKSMLSGAPCDRPGPRYKQLLCYKVPRTASDQPAVTQQPGFRTHTVTQAALLPAQNRKEIGLKHDRQTDGQTGEPES